MKPTHVLFLFAATACGLGSCAKEEPQAPEVEAWTPPEGIPEDTAYMVLDEPITKSQIDHWVDIYKQIEPDKSEHHLRRLVLTNYNLPVAVGASLDPDGRVRALGELSKARDKVLNGEPLSMEGPQVETLHNHWKSEMGLDRWGMGQKTPVGEWSEIFETAGGWTMVRVVGAPDPWLPNSKVTLEHLTVYYLPPNECKEIITEGFKTVPVRVVDKDWKRYMPTFYLYGTRYPQTQ